MTDGGKTRNVKAVQRRAKTPVAEQATGPVKAVRRAPKPLGLLPEDALKGSSFRFLETNPGWGISTTDRYEVQLADRTPVLYTPQKFSLLPGWHFEVRDMRDALLFTLSLGLKKLVMRKLTVFTPEAEELGRLEQRFSLLEVKFDILNPDGSLRFTLYQPAAKYTSYDIRDGDFQVARIAKDALPPRKARRGMVKDAFRVDFESSTLDERDRVLIIAAALFMDRVFHTGEDD